MTRDEITEIIEKNDIDKFKLIKNEIDVHVLINLIIDVKIFFGIMFFTSKIQKLAWKKLKRGEYRQNIVEI